METTNNNGNKSLLYAVLLIFLCWCLFGCGARKVDKSKTITKENTVAETSKVDNSKTVTVTQDNSKIIDSTSTEEFTIAPIDSTKEMNVAGTKYKNAVLRHKKVNSNKTVVKNVAIAETRQNDVKEASKTQISKSATIEIKKVDKKQFNILSLWWVLLIIIAVIWYYKKYGFGLPFKI